MQRNVAVADYQTQVVEQSKTAPVVSIFWATWCAPCKTLKPLLIKLANAQDFDLALVQITGQQDCAAVGVRSVPTVEIYKAGVKVGGWIGARTLPTIEQTLKDLGVIATLDFE